MRRWIREKVAENSWLDGQFRRRVWSRIHFPEPELRALNALAAGQIDCGVDVGAALGSYTWVLSRKSRLVVAYEPGHRHHEALSQAVAGTSVELVRAAVGARGGTLKLYTPGDTNDGRHMATLSSLNPVSQAPGTLASDVRVVSLDQDLPARLRSGATVDLVKIDVEGFENEVLEGARGIVEGHRPTVIAEIEARHNPRYREAFEFLFARDYSAFYWQGGAYRQLTTADIEPLQTPESLRIRLSGEHSEDSPYINNFVFQHPDARIKIA